MPVDGEGWLEFAVRCWDNSLNTQPTYVRSACTLPPIPPLYVSVKTNTFVLGNWDLHVTSSCHRIKLYSINKSRPATAARLKKFEDAGIPFLPITQPGETELEDDEHYNQEMAARGGRDPME